METSSVHQSDYYSYRHRSLWWLFSACALACIGLFFVPAFIIRPFSHQTSPSLMLAMALRQRAPWGTLILAVVCVMFALVLWRVSNLWCKIVLSVVMLLVV